MERKAFMLIGASKIKKDAWIKEFIDINKNCSIELFDNSKNRDIYKILAEEKNDILIIDTTYDSFKHRIHLYKKMKENNYDVTIIFIYFSKTEHLTQGVSTDELELFYQKTEPPLVGFDCDRYECITEENPSTCYIDTMLSNDGIKTSHYSPYHTESIQEHSELIKKNFLKSFNGSKYSHLDVECDIKTIASFHDMGKVVCRKTIDYNIAKPHEKWFIEKAGRMDTFQGHEKVSACYHALVFEKMQDLASTKTISKAIRLHMERHQGPINEKLSKRYRLTEYEIWLLGEFAKYDSMSCIRSEYMDEYNKMKKEYKGVNKND